MNSKRSTKSALLSSVISLLLCVCMLIGTTFAWFTDTASTGVNTIESGTLDVELQINKGTTDAPDWVSAQGQTLDWVVGDGEEAVWGPGCTFTLPELRVVNKGDLDAKFKLVINGTEPTDRPDLREVLEWTVKIVSSEGTKTYNYFGRDVEDGRLFQEREWHLPAADDSDEESASEENISDTILISATLPARVGGANLSNDYQGLSVQGVSVTVLAAQDTGEFDSFDNQYDKDALYCALATPVDQTRDIGVKMNSAGWIAGTSGEKITVGKTASPFFKFFTQPNTTSENPHYQVTDVDGTLQEKITTTGGTDHVIYDISYTYKPAGGGPEIDIHGFNIGITHTFQLSKGLTNVVVTHEGKAENESQTNYGKFTSKYNENNGILDITSFNFSRFEVSFDYDFEAATGGQGYTSLQAAMDAAPSGGTVTLLRDVKRATINVNKSLNFDLNGHEVECTTTNDAAFHVEPGVTCSITSSRIENESVVNGKIKSSYQAIQNYGTLTELSSLEMTGGGIVNCGTINEIDGVTLDATGVGIVNGNSKGNGTITTIRNATINAGSGEVISNNAGSQIGTIEGVKMRSSSGNAIVNNGEIGSIQGFPKDDTTRRTEIYAKTFGIQNSGLITTIKKTYIETEEKGTGIFNTGGKTIYHISDDVTIKATTGISNQGGTIQEVSGVKITTAVSVNDSGEIESIENPTFTTVTGISNSGEINVIQNPNITAAAGIHNSGTIDTIKGTADANGAITDGKIETTGFTIQNQKEIGTIADIELSSSKNYCIQNNQSATIETIQNARIDAVGIGIRNAGTIVTIGSSTITVNDGSGGLGDYGIYHDAGGTVGTTSELTFNGYKHADIGGWVASSTSTE